MPSGITLDLNEKVVLVTGAAHGIGRGIAKEFATQGSTVWVTDCDAPGAGSVLQEIRATGGNAEAHTYDVGNCTHCDRLLWQIARVHGRLDVLVHNAAQWSGKPLWAPDPAQRASADDWEKVCRANLIGPQYLLQQAADLMREKTPMLPSGNRGAIIVITSIHDTVLRRHHGPDYSATKAGQAMLVKEFAVAMGPYGIRVNGVAPGAIETDTSLVDAGERRTKSQRRFCPLRWETGLPADVARTCLFLASDFLSSYLTGTIVEVSGGLHLWNHWCEKLPPAPETRPPEA